MREIEIKVRVQNPERTLAALKKHDIQLGRAKKQHDVVYGQPGDDGGVGDGFIHSGNWLRVRTEDDKTVIFTLKRSVTSELDSIEHEVVVDNADELTAIIHSLGYELYSDLVKMRRKVMANGFEICYDELPDLGTFMEFEKLCDDNADITAVREELWKIATSLGLKQADEETSGYDVLLRHAQGMPA